MQVVKISEKMYPDVAAGPVLIRVIVFLIIFGFIGKTG